MRTIQVFISMLLVASTALASAKTPAPKVDSLAAAYQADINVLAADDMEGRGLGTAGAGRAAEWIEKRLRSLGLKPAFGSSYRQGFDVKTGVSMLDGNTLSGLKTDDWTPLGFSSSGSFDGELAFVGYGIEAEPLKFREFEGIDLKGKVALMLRYEPQERDEKSPFEGKKPSRWSSARYKVHQAKQRGAVAVIFVSGPLQDEGKDKVPALRNDGPESSAGIPVIQVRTTVAQKWLSGSSIDLATFQKEVDADLKPRSLGSTGVRLSGTVALKTSYAAAENVAAILPGKGALAGEYIVIGAHYDHLGFGGERSMKPNERAVHNGADDNASGVIAALHAAAILRDSLKSEKSHRSILVALFAAEELGLGGSAHFVANTPVAKEKYVAMINLDMVGRLKDSDFAALGSDSAPEWAALLERIAKPLGLKVRSGGDGYGPSDQTSFYAAQVPVVHFFTGTHDAYHSPADDPATINAEGAARITRLTAAVVEEIATGRTTPKYARMQTAPATEGDSRGYGAYLGTVPDYRAMGATTGGAMISDVRPGGPAEAAGLKGGDTIVEIGGTKIDNLYDMTFALQDNKPGETVDVIVLRNNERVRLRATLGSRSDRGKEAAPPGHGETPKK